MKKKTQRIISAIPVVGSIFDSVTGPRISSRLMEDPDFDRALKAYAARHSDEAITRITVDEILESIRKKNSK